MLEKSIFLVCTLVLHPWYFIFLVLHPLVLQKVRDFTFKALVPSKTLGLLLCLFLLLTVLLIILRAVRYCLANNQKQNLDSVLQPKLN